MTKYIKKKTKKNDEYDVKLGHDEILINGRKRKLSKSSQYFLDMLTVEEEK
jgi:hypothetical protein